MIGYEATRIIRSGIGTRMITILKIKSYSCTSCLLSFSVGFECVLQEGSRKWFSDARGL